MKPAIDRKKLMAMALTAVLTGAGVSTALAADLILKVQNVASAEGTLRVALYDSQQDFDATRIYRALAHRASAGAMAVRLSDLPAGDYAVMLFHDQNGNEKLDTNLLGIPSEPWGASLQGKSVFGAPGWSDVMFTMAGENKTINIDLD